jgi:hypothetical protein
LVFAPLSVLLFELAISINQEYSLFMFWKENG